MIDSDYLSKPLSGETLNQLIKEAVIRLRRMKDKFDSIAFRGLSGALLAPAIAAKLGKNLIAVRKDKGRHSNYKVEGEKDCEAYVIVDDFVSSGATLRSIIQSVNTFTNNTAKPIGVYLYLNRAGTSCYNSACYDIYEQCPLLNPAKY